MSPSKRRVNDENAFTPTRTSRSALQVFGTPGPLQTSPVNIIFTDGFTPVPKLKKRRFAQPYTPEDLTRLQKEREVKEAELRKEQEMVDVTDAARKLQQTRDNRLNISLEMLKSLGWTTLDDFMDALVTTKHPTRSSQVSRYIARHGGDFLDKVRDRQPRIANDWAISTTRKLLEKESHCLAERFRPPQDTPICDILEQFSLSGFLADAETLAPSMCQLLRQIKYHSQKSGSAAFYGAQESQASSVYYN
jgi:hypothetical protein